MTINEPQPEVRVTMMNLLWPRDGLDVRTFYDYWVGAHTQISSRLPGIHQYFQHQLDPEGGRLLPRIHGVVTDMDEDERFYGDAEITFVSHEDLRRFADALHPLMEDEQNVFRKTISYQALDENSVTVMDRSSDDSPNGSVAPHQKFMLYLRRRPEVATQEFRATLLRSVALKLAAAPEVVKVRIRLPEAYDNDAVTLLAPNVSNREEPDRQYQGSIELMFQDATGRQSFCCSDTWTAVAAELRHIACAVHRQQVLRTYTVYNHGAITTAGLRSPWIADQIALVGAVNQTGDEVRRLLLQEHTASASASVAHGGTTGGSHD